MRHPVRRSARCLWAGQSGRTAWTLPAVLVLLLGLAWQLAQAAPGQAPKLTLVPSQPANACVNIDGHTAPVRAIGFSPDSTYLCTAGMDKVVHVWRLPERAGEQAKEKEVQAPRAKAILRQHWGKVRTLRWEVARGLRGMIYALAVQPKTGQLAIGGYGARGTMGEIIWLEPHLGEFIQARYDHRESIVGLCYSASGNWLASMDLAGRALLWPAAGGDPRQLTPADTVKRKVNYRPIVIVGDDTVVLPMFDRQAAGGQSVWRLQQYAISRGALGGSLVGEHRGEVTALAASPDGRYFASADQAGSLFIWQSGQLQPWKSLRPGLPVVSLCFTPDGRTLVAGTRLAPGVDRTELQVWDVAAGTLLRRRPLEDHVYACAISPDGQRLAYTGGQGYEVFVEWLNPPGECVTIPGGKRVAEVAFARDAAEYEVVFTSLPGSPLGGASKTFSPASLEARDESPPTFAPNRFLGRWSCLADPKLNRLWLYRDRQPQGYVQLDRQTQGDLICQAFIPGADGEPSAVAVGTEIQNGVFVYGLARQGECPMLRYCRGHYGRVTSLGASRDGKYLVSGSTDGTVRFWTLRGCHGSSALSRRWGATLQPAATGRGLTVASIDDLGPLYQKGVRRGDQIQKIMWVEAGSVRTEERSAEMLRQLDLLPWDLQVTFYPNRDGQEVQPFNLRGGWHEMLAFYATDEDWIAWTPAGYYACSPSGGRMMGWLVNHAEINHPPAFYTAEQFDRALYRPDVIRALLKEGSLERALGIAGVAVEDRAEDPLDVEPPEVRILAPTQRNIVQDKPEITVSAQAVPKGNNPIDEMRLYVNESRVDPRQYAKGVVRERPRGKSETWLVPLVPGENLIKAAAVTDTCITYSEGISVTYTPTGPAPKPSLYVVAVGISKYPESVALPLQCAELDAQNVASVFEKWTSGLFGKQEIRVYVEPPATRSDIIEGLDWLKKQMKSTDDVGVFFYSGHGMTDNGKFYLVPVDGKLAETCVSEDEVMNRLSTTIGRRVLMLDACHSGGIDLRAQAHAGMDELTRRCNNLENGVVLLASSNGKEPSWEDPDWGGGAFAVFVCEGLRGGADMEPEDKLIETDELAPYVRRHVLQLTKKTGKTQDPVYATPPIDPVVLTTSKAGTP